LTLPEEIDYIYLESLDYIKDNNNIKMVHIVQLIDEEITIGRKDNNDIIINDISISREHALLRYDKNNGNLFLEDKNGKFGTLVLVRGNIKITEEKTYFQIGKTYMEVKEEYKNF
jgi:pSer/pThr/pTyr-binding forkhead associated (FHA) protein